jgi:hypothetical protein
MVLEKSLHVQPTIIAILIRHLVHHCCWEYQERVILATVCGSHQDFTLKLLPRVPEGEFPERAHLLRFDRHWRSCS